MRFLKLGFPFLLISIIAISCKKENVVASFELSSTDIYIDEEFTITNTSKNSNYYQWSFDDDTYAISENPTHSYSEAGTYTISLTAIGDEDANNTSQEINVTAIDYSIYEGKGVDDIELGDTWETISSSYITDTLYQQYYDSDIGFYIHYVLYQQEGLYFVFFNENDTLAANDNLYLIFIITPYTGNTKKGIKIGSSINSVIKSYGSPKDSNNDGEYIGYFYDNQGVDFYTESDSDEIIEIQIYDPSFYSSPANETKLNIDKLKKISSHYRSIK